MSRDSGTREYLDKAFELVFQEISFCLESERKRKVPLPQTAKAMANLRGLIAESRGLDMLEHRRKAVGNTEPLDNYDAIPTLADEVAEAEVVNGSPALALPPGLAADAAQATATPQPRPRKERPPEDPELRRLQDNYRQMPEADRMLARHEFQLLRRALKLRVKMAKEKQEAEKAGQKPPEEPK